MNTIEITCSVCQKLFYKSKSEYNRQIRLRGSLYRPVCSALCRNKLNQTLPIVPCVNCNKLIKGHSDGSNAFCCRSCSASYNNAKHPKRKKIHKCCTDCGVLVESRSKRCKSCNNQIRLKKKIVEKGVERFVPCTLGDLFYKSNTKSNAYGSIRGRARTVFKNSGKPARCQNCGYDKHVEIAHIRPISTFSMEDLIEVINSLDNLICLCPNCHWEFDHGYTPSNLVRLHNL